MHHAMHGSHMFHHKVLRSPALRRARLWFWNICPLLPRQEPWKQQGRATPISVHDWGRHSLGYALKPKSKAVRMQSKTATISPQFLPSLVCHDTVSGMGKVIFNWWSSQQHQALLGFSIMQLFQQITWAFASDPSFFVIRTFRSTLNMRDFEKKVFHI